MRPLLQDARTRKIDKIDKHLYESIMDGITSGVWVADKNNVIYYANKAMER
jgi:nitrogen fixation/metabolism regulation signal transduction histidine kinase